MRSLLLCFMLVLVQQLNAQELAFYRSELQSQNQPSFIYDIAKDGDGALWVATGQGVLKKSLNTDTLFQHPASSGYSNFASAIFSTGNELWIGYYDGSICQWVDGQLKAPFCKVQGKVQDLIISNDSLYFIADQQLYKSSTSPNSETISLRKNTNCKELIVVDSEIFVSTTKGVKALYNDTWISKTEIICSFKSANNLYALTPNALITLGTSGTENRSINLDPTWVVEDFVVLDDAASVIIAGNFGLASFSLSDKKEPQLLPGLLPELETAVRKLFLYDQTLWIGTYGESLWFSRPYANPIWYEAWVDFSSDGQLWAAKNGKGISVGIAQNYQLKQISELKSTAPFSVYREAVYLLEKGNLIRSYPTREIISKISGIQSSEVLKFGFIDPQTLYVCLRHRGMVIFDVESGDEIAKFSTENGLLHNDITQVLKGNGKDLWLLTRKNGITLLRDKQIQRYFTLNDGLPSLDITAMTYFNNELWLSTEGGGLAVIDSEYRCHQVRLQKNSEPEYFYGIGKNSEALFAYSRDYFLQLQQEGKEEFTIPKYQKSVVPSEGEISSLNQGIVIPCYNGILYIPSKTFENETPFKVSIANISSDLQGPLKDSSTLDYGSHEIKLKFELNGSNPLTKKDCYYILEGYHKSWQALNSSKVVLNAVRSGSYSLKVKQQGKENTLYQFKVDIPLWRKPVFMAVVALALLLGYIGLLRWRTYRLKQRNQELEKIVAARTKDLAKRNEELQQFTYAISHDLKNPAANIGELIRAIKEDFPDLDEDFAFYLKQLDKASGKLYNNLIDLLEVLKHANEGELPKDDISLPNLIDDIKDKISGIIAKNNAEIHCDFQAFDHLNYNKLNLHSIIYNLVSNGIKYRRPEVDPVVEISSLEKDGYLALKIKDNGLGMDLSQNKNELFGLFKRFHDHVEGTGVGLYLVNAMVEKEGGKIEVASELNKGTEFTLYLVPKAL